MQFRSFSIRFINSQSSKQVFAFLRRGLELTQIPIRARSEYLRAVFKLFFPVLPPIFSRSVAAIGPFLWIIALIGISITTFLFFARFVFADVPATLFIAAVIILISSLIGLNIVSTSGDSRAAGLRDKSIEESFRQALPREKFSFRIILLSFALLTIVIFDWKTGPLLSTGSLVIMLVKILEAGLYAFIIAPLVAFQISISAYLWKQIRGWNNRPFEEWTIRDHEAMEIGGQFNHRYPSPNGTNFMTDTEARTHALVADSRADKYWMLSQVTIIIGTIVASALVAILFDLYLQRQSFQDVAQSLAVVFLSMAILTVVIGVRMSHITVSLWRNRAIAYKAHVETANSSEI